MAFMRGPSGNTHASTKPNSAGGSERSGKTAIDFLLLLLSVNSWSVNVELGERVLTSATRISEEPARGEVLKGRTNENQSWNTRLFRHKNTVGTALQHLRKGVDKHFILPDPSAERRR